MKSASLMVRLNQERTNERTTCEFNFRGKITLKQNYFRSHDVTHTGYLHLSALSRKSGQNIRIESQFSFRQSNSNRRSSNQFIDFILLLHDRPTLQFRERTCHHGKFPDESIHIYSCLPMFPRTYTLSSQTKTCSRKMPGSINKRLIFLSDIE